MQSDMMPTLESAKKENLRSWGWLIHKQELSDQAKHGLLALPSKEGKDPPILCWIHEEQADEKISGVTSKIKMGGFAAGGGAGACSSEGAHSRHCCRWVVFTLCFRS